MCAYVFYLGKGALYTQQTHVGLGVGLGLWLTDMLCNCWVSRPFICRSSHVVESFNTASAGSLNSSCITEWTRTNTTDGLVTLGEVPM